MTSTLCARCAGPTNAAAIGFRRPASWRRFANPHGPLLSRTWDFRESLTTYDALYVALAEALDAPLLTFDARMAAAPGVAATVAVIGLG